MTYRKGFPDLVVGAVLLDNTAAFSSIFCPEEETTRLDHDGQLI